MSFIEVEGLTRKYTDSVFALKDVSFAVEFFIGEQRRGHKVGQQVKGPRQVFVEDSDVVAGDFSACERIDVSADRIALDGDLARGAVAGSFEKRVLDEVRDPVERGGFVARTGAHPYSDRRGPHMIHSFRNNCKAVIEDCLFDGTCLLDHIAPGRDANIRVERRANHASEVRDGRQEGGRRKAEGGWSKAEGGGQRLKVRNHTRARYADVDLCVLPSAF